MIYVPHTTAGVTINESADPAVAQDILTTLARMVPDDGPYRHAEGNSPAHVMASLVGASAMVRVQSGRLGLGTWQGVFLAEFDCCFRSYYTKRTHTAADGHGTEYRLRYQ
jgi:secondary thiamine-phosphate synthase enzyme